jgi:ferrochelatase
MHKEPTYTHGTPTKTAIMLVNLGTPDSPDAPAVKRYLAEFLSDSRVVEIPKLAWLPILHGIILQIRPKKSAAKYQTIWTKQGSPLRIYTEAQSKMLQGYLGQQGITVDVVYAMNYGNPSITSVLQQLKTQHVDRLLVVPMYPQYSATTTASVMDRVYRQLQQMRNPPELRLIKHFHDHPAYIQAMAQQIQGFWLKHGKPTKLVMSFHGIPKRNLMLGDPYHCEAYKSARLIAEQLGIGKDDYVVTFQSRFGKQEWLKPYTEPTMIELAKAGVERVDVVCPGFVSDCLETLEEIQGEVKEAFMHHGGREFNYIPCLNDQPHWIHALVEIVKPHLAGWPITSATLADHTAEFTKGKQVFDTMQST